MKVARKKWLTQEMSAAHTVLWELIVATADAIKSQEDGNLKRRLIFEQRHNLKVLIRMIESAKK